MAMVLRGVSTSQKVYDFLVDYMKANHGIAPTMREICEGAGLSSTSTANRMLRGLAKQKRIAFIRPEGLSAARGFYLVGAKWLPPSAVPPGEER